MKFRKSKKTLKNLIQKQLDPETTRKNFFTGKKPQTGDKQGTACQWEKLFESLLKQCWKKMPGKSQLD